MLRLKRVELGFEVPQVWNSKINIKTNRNSRQRLIILLEFHLHSLNVFKYHMFDVDSFLIQFSHQYSPLNNVPILFRSLANLKFI